MDDCVVHYLMYYSPWLGEVRLHNNTVYCTRNNGYLIHVEFAELELEELSRSLFTLENLAVVVRTVLYSTV